MITLVVWDPTLLYKTVSYIIKRKYTPGRPWGIYPLIKLQQNWVSYFTSLIQINDLLIRTSSES